MIERATPIPTLGPRGEGWVLIQTALLAGVAVAGLAGPRLPENLQAPGVVIATIAGGAGLLLAASAVATLGKSGSPFPSRRLPPSSRNPASSRSCGIRSMGGSCCCRWRGRWHAAPGRSSPPARSPSRYCSSRGSKSAGSSTAIPRTRATGGACAASSPTSGEDHVDRTRRRTSAGMAAEAVSPRGRRCRRGGIVRSFERSLRAEHKSDRAEAVHRTLPRHASRCPWHPRVSADGRRSTPPRPEGR
jgi:hypothetical protein